MLPLLKSSLNLLNPLGLVWAGLLLLTLSLVRRRLKGHVIMAGGLWILLTVSTCFPFWGLRLSALEDPWRSIAGRWDALPTADAIVLPRRRGQHQPAGSGRRELDRGLRPSRDGY